MSSLLTHGAAFAGSGGANVAADLADTPLVRFARRDLPGGDAGSGVYRFRDLRTGEVLYIGQSGNVGRRMRDYFDGGVSTRGRIHRLLYVDGWAHHVGVEIIPTAVPKALERALLTAHVSDRGELPRWNLRAPSRGSTIRGALT